MKATPTELPEVVILEPRVHRDARGFFLESWNARAFAEAIGSPVEFVQDNHSRSVGPVVRGIHYQLVRPQGKLVRVVAGTVFDVAVDLRRGSPTFGRWVGVELSAANARQLWIPPSFGHAFMTLTDEVDFLYKTTDYWWAEHDRVVAWDDPEIGIRWPRPASAVTLSERDARAPRLAVAECYPAPGDGGQ